jgi:hypothetical protein
MMMILIIEARMISTGRLAISSASTPANTEMRFGAPVHEKTPKSHQQSRLILRPAMPEMAATPSKQHARPPPPPNLSSMRTD